MPAKKDPIVRCRYTGKYQRCTGEAVDPIGEVLLCTEHLARAVELLRSRGVEVTMSAALAR